MIILGIIASIGLSIAALLVGAMCIVAVMGWVEGRKKK